jgi:hypothetical protein
LQSILRTQRNIDILEAAVEHIHASLDKGGLRGVDEGGGVRTLKGSTKVAGG